MLYNIGSDAANLSSGIIMRYTLGQCVQSQNCWPAVLGFGLLGAHTIAGKSQAEVCRLVELHGSTNQR